MAFLAFISSYYTIFMILSGLMGMVWGIERFFRKAKEESKILRYLAIGIGLFMYFVLVLMLVNDPTYSVWSFIIIFIFSTSLIAMPLKRIPLAFFVSFFVASILLILLLLLRANDPLIITGISLKIFLIVIAVIVLLILLLSFAAEQVIDVFLSIIGISPVVFLLGLLAVVQAIMILVTNDPKGLF